MKDRILVDTREQLPWIFHSIPTSRKKLKYGDYALRGMEKICAVERKSVEDMAGTMTSGLRRFMKCARGAAKSGMRLILVVEGTYEDVASCLRHWSPGRRPSKTLGRFIALTGVSPVFASGRTSAQAIALAMLLETSESNSFR